MDLNLLTTFLSVYNHQSITLAAEELRISQPAVSAALKRLETSLGKPLFVRDGRGIAPTSFSVALAKKVRQPLSILENACEQSDHVKLYCSELLLHKVANLEGIDIAATPVREQEIVDNIVTQKVDIVIDVMRNSFSSLISEELYQEEAVCLTRRKHPRIGKVLTKEQFYAEKHIAWRIRRDNQNTLEFLAERPVQERKVKIETESISSMLSLASKTNYIASATRSIAEELAPIFDLDIHDYPIKLKPVKINMIYHRRHLNDPFHKKARERVRRALAIC